MYYLLSLFSGVLIAIMITLNGALSETYGLHWATVFIHFVGLCLIAAIVLVKRARPFAAWHPWWFYIGGMIGVMNTIANNFAFGRISVSAILALVLLGQSVAGLLIDHYGLWGVPRHPFRKGTLVGLLLILAGIAPMLTDFELLAVVLSFATGIGVVLSRTFNAKLAEVTNIETSTFFHFLIGLAVSLPVFWLLGDGETPLLGFRPTSGLYVYIGGLIGVTVITLSNAIVLKISAFFLTLFIFIGQVFTGVLIDALLDGAFSGRILFGGILVTAGLAANLLLDRKREQKSK